MWANTGTRAAAGQPEHALAVLVNLTRDAANRQPMWADAATRGALLVGAAADQPAEVREEALWALHNLAVDAANRQPMWADPATRVALLVGAAAGQPAYVREEALTVLRNLTVDAANMQPMWADVATRAVLLAGAAAGQPAIVLEEALWALHNLAGDAANRQPMWADVATRAVLLTGAAADQPANVRMLARAALGNLAVDAANRQPMWADARLAPARDGVAQSVVTSAPSEVGNGLMGELDGFEETAEQGAPDKDVRDFAWAFTGGFTLGTEPPVRDGPSQGVPASVQGVEGTCMCHALMRVVLLQLQHKYGLEVGLEAAVEALIQVTQAYCADTGGLDIDTGASDLSKLRLLSHDKNERYELDVTATTFKDFDALVLAVRNSRGQRHIVSGTHDHAVVPTSVEESINGAAKVLCFDSQTGKETRRLGRVGNGGANPASRFHSFHIIDTTVRTVFVEGCRKTKPVPTILKPWAERFGTTSAHLTQRLLAQDPASFPLPASTSFSSN